MRQFPLTQCVYNWIQYDYVSEIISYKCKKGLLYDVIIAGLVDLRDAFRLATKGEIEVTVAPKTTIMVMRNPKHYEDYVKLIINKLKNLLYATPTEFINYIIPAFERLIIRDEVNLPLSIDGGSKVSLSDRLVQIMRYNTVRKKIAPSFFRLLGVKSCVYCNANYAVTDADGNGYFDMDHWKPKALYPYLCISFFNFQPSCPSCNRRKSDSDEPFFGLWNDRPVTDLDVLDFELSDLSRIMYLVFGNKDVLDVKLVPSNPADPNNLKLCNVANSVFHINSRYKEHNDVTEEIVWKSWIYSPAYLYSLRNAFSHGILSYIDVGRFILGNYIAPDDIHQRPLSRMTQAVARQLGII